MRDLQDVELRQPVGEQDRVHVILGVTGEQEPAPVRFSQHHDRRVVDAPPRGGRLERNRALLRPQDAEADLVQLEMGTGGERGARRTMAQGGVPRLPAGPRAVHARLVDTADAISLQDADQPSHVVLVRVGQDDDVDAAVPGRDPRVQLEEQAVRVGSAVHQHPGAAAALEQDRVPLADVEHHEAGHARRGVAHCDR